MTIIIYKVTLFLETLHDLFVLYLVLLPTRKRTNGQQVLSLWFRFSDLEGPSARTARPHPIPIPSKDPINSYVNLLGLVK